MEDAILFKIIQRKLKFRNPQHLQNLPTEFVYSEDEYRSAREYILSLRQHDIRYSHPGKDDYPRAFLRMKEPPLFFEYYGEPLWSEKLFLAVVGSREITALSEQWLKNHLEEFIKTGFAGVVSGGAKGVDQLSHLIAIKNKVPTIFVLPSGLLHLYPSSLSLFRNAHMNRNMCFISEFEITQKLHKSHFYFRNRLIAALGQATLVVQATKKSGSFLTVHHCLEMGRPVITIPAHPEMSGFDGNLKLLHEGAYPIRHFRDLHDFWVAESWSN